LSSAHFPLLSAAAAASVGHCVRLGGVIADLPISVGHPKTGKGTKDGDIGTVLGEQGEEEGGEQQQNGNQNDQIRL
jgi:hypothetical protein